MQKQYRNFKSSNPGKSPLLPIFLELTCQTLSGRFERSSPRTVRDKWSLRWQLRVGRGRIERLGESGATHDSQSASLSGVEAWVARNLNRWDESDARPSQGWVRCPSGLASLHHSGFSTDFTVFIKNQIEKCKCAQRKKTKSHTQQKTREKLCLKDWIMYVCVCVCVCVWCILCVNAFLLDHRTSCIVFRANWSFLLWQSWLVRLRLT